MDKETLEQLNNKFPFLTIGTYADETYVGIIQNSDEQITSMYVYNEIGDSELKKKFLACGERWWWESNRKLPINMFLGDEFKVFKPYLKTFVTKNFNIQYGPKVCLSNIMEKRVKRRSIQLIRRDFD